MSDRRNDVRPFGSWLLLGALALGAGDVAAATKVLRASETPEAPATAVAQAAPAKTSTDRTKKQPATTTTAKPTAKAPATSVAPARPAARSGAAAASPAGAKSLTLPSRRPIVLDALHVEGRTEAPRVLFVHAGPTVALEDAPAHPSYLRDDFTAALSSPVRVRVRGGAPVRPTTAGGNR